MLVPPRWWSAEVGATAVRRENRRHTRPIGVSCVSMSLMKSIVAGGLIAVAIILVACVGSDPTASLADGDGGDIVAVAETSTDASVALDDSAIDAGRFCAQLSGTLFCADFDDLLAGKNGEFLDRVEIQGGTVSLSTDGPKSLPRALEARGLAVAPPSSSLALLSAILTTNGVPHLSIELDVRLEGAPSGHQTIQLVELVSSGAADPFIALVDDNETGWSVSLTGGPTPVFADLPAPANIQEWFHVAIDLTLGAGDAGSVKVTLAGHTAEKIGVHTSPNEAGAAGNVYLKVGVDSYGSAAIDTNAPPFVVHIDNVVVRQ